MNKFPERLQKSPSFFARVLAANFLPQLLFPLEKLTEKRVISSDGTEILQISSLTKYALNSLFQNKVLAIHIPRYYEKKLSIQLAKAIIEQNLKNWNVSDLKKSYKESDFFVFGMPFNMALKTEKAWEEYFQTSEKVNQLFKEILPETLSPIEKIREDINRAFKPGVITRKYQGFEMTPGLVRVMYGKDKIQEREVPLNCHADCLPWLSSREGQYSINLYLNTPSKGGELYIWNPKIKTFLDFLKNWYFIKNFFLTPTYLNEELQQKIQPCLSNNYQKIKVNVGDLIIFNTARPHAIAEFEGESRVSYQVFLNYKKGKALEMWA